jgi:hypothetical protein
MTKIIFVFKQLTIFCIPYPARACQPFFVYRFGLQCGRGDDKIPEKAKISAGKDLNGLKKIECPY